MIIPKAKITVDTDGRRALCRQTRRIHDLFSNICDVLRIKWLSNVYCIIITD